MTLPAGIFIALGILAYVILWRYIFLQFFKLLKPFEGSQDSSHTAEPNLVDIVFSNCTELSHEDHEKSCRIVANILPPKQSVVLSFELLSSVIQPESYVNLSNRLLVLEFYQKLNCENRVLEEIQRFANIPDAYRSLKLGLRWRIDNCGMSMVMKKDKSEMPKLREIEGANDEDRDTQRSGNRVFRDVDRSFDHFEVIKCQAMPLGIKPDVQLGGEEKDLNTTIRRLVAAELMKCCEKEHGAISRAHSDTNNRVNWKRNKYNKQGGNFHENPAPSFRDSDTPPKELTHESVDLESIPTFLNLAKKSDDLLGKRINTDSTPKFVTGDVAEGDQSCKCNYEDEDRDNGIVENVAIVETDVSISYREEHGIKKPWVTENVAATEEPKTQIRTTGADTKLQPNMTVRKYEDVSTQTEDMYMIRAVRSCPGRRRRFQLLETSRGISKARSTGKTFPLDISLPPFLYRKASDNLIYEMSKGSRSPSYIPVPERFRWRYIMPNKVT